MTPRHIGGVLLVGALSGLVAGWLRPVPEDAGQADGGGADWSVPSPSVAERSSAASFEIAMGIRWVGGVPAHAEQEEAATQWTLQGVLLPEGAALIQVGAEPLIKRFQTGDILPDGSRLAAVERDAIELDRGGCRERRTLYPSSPNSGAAGAGCTTATPEEEVQPQ